MGPRDRVIAGLHAGLPYGAASLLLGLSFGVLARPLMGPVATIVMSTIVFAGSAQFAALAVLSAGGGAPAAIVAGMLLNLRFAPMGIAIAPSLRAGPLGRALRGQALVDASWALANRGGGRFDIDFLLGSTLAQYPAWVGGTVAGALAGGLIGNPRSLGLDAIFPAFFLGLLVAELRRPQARPVAALGAVIALVLTPLTPAGVPIIVAAAAVFVAAGWSR
ncbi:MAG TPA: AzlC family ABC transporter permease [Solirubrobacteraceae bacterium]|nr:AzlC family ABC transporter permease [Solirubrobacteraceae bacterium]